MIVVVGRLKVKNERNCINKEVITVILFEQSAFLKSIKK